MCRGLTSEQQIPRGLTERKTKASGTGKRAYGNDGWALVEAAADGTDQFGGTFGYFHDRIGSFGAVV
jgi:hypothetical protein